MAKKRITEVPEVVSNEVEPTAAESIAKSLRMACTHQIEGEQIVAMLQKLGSGITLTKVITGEGHVANKIHCTGFTFFQDVHK